VKIIVFHGSPRIEGNTDILLNEAIRGIGEGGHDIKVFKLNFMNIKPCQDCGGCEKTGTCIINDDMGEICDCHSGKPTG